MCKLLLCVVSCLTVISSTCPSYVGTTGIVVQEFKHVFKLITKENKFKGETLLKVVKISFSKCSFNNKFPNFYSKYLPRLPNWTVIAHSSAYWCIRIYRKFIGDSGRHKPSTPSFWLLIFPSQKHCSECKRKSHFSLRFFLFV